MKKLRFFYWVLAFALLIASAPVLNRIFVRKTASNRLYDLMNSETPTDIFFVGTSRIMDGIIPVELWKERGYTSYILCSEYSDMDRNIMMLRLALQYKKPRLVVLDVDNYWTKSDPDNVLRSYHEFADAFPLNRVKLDTTLELYGDYASRLELLFPFYMYHQRWDSLKKEDFLQNKSSFIMKGYEYSDDVREVSIPEPVAAERAILGDMYGVASIRRFAEFCRANDIELMMTVLPFEADEDEQCYLAGLSILAQELSVPLLNMSQERDLVDGSTDFKNESHLNISGAEKITRRVGAYIEENFDIPDTRQDVAVSESWSRAVAEFEEEYY